MPIRVTTSGGRTSCAICHKQLELGDIVIKINSWNFSAQVHSRVEDCNPSKR